MSVVLVGVVIVEGVGGGAIVGVGVTVGVIVGVGEVDCGCAGIWG